MEILMDKSLINALLTKLSEITSELDESKEFKYICKDINGDFIYLSDNDIKELIKITKDDVSKWIKEGRIPSDIYELIAKPNTPLPKMLYVKPKEGRCWFQHHIRGITQEEKEAYDGGKKSLSDIIVGHSVHCDMRAALGEEKLVQWVFTDNTVDDYYKMYTGALRKTKGGISNVQHSLAIVKPSAEPKESIIKGISEPAIDKNGAKLIEKLDMKKYSYWIAPGDVGASSYKWAYMSCFWLGKVKTGVGRPDYHEYFLYPEKRNDDKILDGRFIIKCLKRPDRTARWEVWKAKTDPRPADSILHKDQGFHMPIKASKLPPNKFGRENYDIKLSI